MEVILHFVFTIFFSLINFALCDVKLPNVVGSGMVLQRDTLAPIWGLADAGEKVTVEFAGQTKETTANNEGKWMVKLENLVANHRGDTMTIKGKNSITLENILVGEVWLCSGQSNMEYPFSKARHIESEIEKVYNPLIRFFNVPHHKFSPVPEFMGEGEWNLCDAKSSNKFSAVGYYFGRRIFEETQIPIGLISSEWVGTRIEAWIAPEGFEIVDEVQKFATEIKNYTEDTIVKKEDPSTIYNSMINPYRNFAMRGVIWYQGEANAMFNDGMNYYYKTHALVEGWRKTFKNDDLAFYWVQLANVRVDREDPKGGDSWAMLREAQTKALDISGTGMAIAIDIGETWDLHPKNKRDVGRRLAQWALHQTYGRKDLVPSGPIYSGHQIEGKLIRLSFDYVGSGLMVGMKQCEVDLLPVQEIKNGILRNFSIKGNTTKWHWANAKIDKNTVVVYSAEVSEPTAVRYAFSTNPSKANLYNKEGLPASPFRTDQD